MSELYCKAPTKFLGDQGSYPKVLVELRGLLVQGVVKNILMSSIYKGVYHMLSFKVMNLGVYTIH